MFDILIWLAVISFAMYGVINKNQTPLGLFVISLTAISTVISAVHNITKGEFDGVLSFFSFNQYMAIMFGFLVYLFSALKVEKLPSYGIDSFSAPLAAWGVFYVILGLISSLSWTGGLFLIVISLCFYLAEKHQTHSSFKYITIVAVNVVAIYYILIFIATGSPFELKMIGNLVIKHHVPAFATIVFLSYYLFKIGVIDSKHADKILGFGITLFGASSLYFHPEAKLHEVKYLSNIKEIIAMGDLGAIGYSASIALFTKTRLV